MHIYAFGALFSIIIFTHCSSRGLSPFTSRGMWLKKGIRLSPLPHPPSQSTQPSRRTIGAFLSTCKGFGLTWCPRQRGGRTTWSYHCAVFVVFQLRCSRQRFDTPCGLSDLSPFHSNLEQLGGKKVAHQNFLVKWRHYWGNQKVGPYYSEVVKGIHQYQERKTFPRCFSFKWLSTLNGLLFSETHFVKQIFIWY